MGSTEAAGAWIQMAQGWRTASLRPMDCLAGQPLGRLGQMSFGCPAKVDFGQGFGRKQWLGCCVPRTSTLDFPGDSQVRRWCSSIQNGVDIENVLSIFKKIEQGNSKVGMTTQVDEILKSNSIKTESIKIVPDFMSAERKCLKNIYGNRKIL
jgi:hypothetical protein